MKDTNATLYFLRRDELFKTEKPYSLDFDSENVPRSNLKAHKVPELPIKDLRTKGADFNFDNNGIEMLKYENNMKYEDWDDQKKIEDIYCEDLGRALIKRLGCSSVQIFDTNVSRRTSCMALY
jgi:hypothetical protein